ncbi:MAG: hypothetical protein IH956_00660, partial [Chloroflexi bacterium]|nr:hypothetical protein [Chloroflexota bacterium]
IISAISAIGNGGNVVRPHLLQEVQDSHGNVLQRFEQSVRGVVPVEPEYLQIVKEAMRQSVARGVAQGAAVAGVEVQTEKFWSEAAALRLPLPPPKRCSPSPRIGANGSPGSTMPRRVRACCRSSFTISCASGSAA